MNIAHLVDELVRRCRLLASSGYHVRFFFGSTELCLLVLNLKLRNTVMFDTLINLAWNCIDGLRAIHIERIRNESGIVLNFIWVTKLVQSLAKLMEPLTTSGSSSRSTASTSFFDLILNGDAPVVILTQAVVAFQSVFVSRLILCHAKVIVLQYLQWGIQGCGLFHHRSLSTRSQIWLDYVSWAFPTRQAHLS